MESMAERSFQFSLAGDPDPSSVAVFTMRNFLTGIFSKTILPPNSNIRTRPQHRRREAYHLRALTVNVKNGDALIGPGRLPLNLFH